MKTISIQHENMRRFLLVRKISVVNISVTCPPCNFPSHLGWVLRLEWSHRLFHRSLLHVTLMGWIIDSLFIVTPMFWRTNVNRREILMQNIETSKRAPKHFFCFETSDDSVFTAVKTLIQAMIFFRIKALNRLLY